MRWLALLAVAGCAVNEHAPINPEPDPEIGRLQGVVSDRATGAPLAGAELYFGSDAGPYTTDADGRYMGEQPAGIAHATIAYDDQWMLTGPIDVVAYKLTTHDFAFAPEPCDAPGVARVDDRDSDRVAELALRAFKRPEMVPLVDRRHAPHTHMLSVPGFEVTTLDELQFEADRRHQIINYVSVDVALEICSARVTITRSCVAPNHEAFGCAEGEIWLYIKEAPGWRRAAVLLGFAT